jgi:hypothetical protein
MIHREKARDAPDGVVGTNLHLSLFDHGFQLGDQV